MAKYTIKYACGHEGTVDLFGKSKTREYEIKRLEKGDCPECEARLTAKENAAFAEERGLPELVGTERQVQWANTLRRTKLSSCEYFIENNIMNMTDVGKDSIGKAMNWLYGQNKASFWIENRYESTDTTIHNAIKELEFLPPEGSMKDEKEFLVAPEESKKEGVVRILIKGDYISFIYEKDSDFRTIVKKHYCKWNGMEWVKETTALTGMADDIAAEIGRDLLDNGFRVSFPDKDVMDMAVNATFEKEHTKWILREDDKKVKIKWRNDLNCYYDAIALRGAKYKSGCVLVPAEYYRSIEDFAAEYDYYISPKARKVLDDAKAKIEGIPVPEFANIPEHKREDVPDPLAELMDED